MLTRRTRPLLLAATALLLSYLSGCRTRSGAEQRAQQPPRTPSASTAGGHAGHDGSAAGSSSAATGATGMAGDPMLRRNLREAIALGGRYLSSATRPSGRFVYRINLDPQVEPQGGYNVLRHAGSLYAMGQIQRRWPNDELRAALLRGAAYLRREHMAPPPGEPELRAVWSKRIKRGLREAKLGGAGLALLSLSRLEAIAPGTTPKAELQGLAGFVRWMQKPDGSFHSKLFTDDRGRSDAWTSLYYPGEAAFGLAAWVGHSGEQRWLRPSLATLVYLAQKRRGKRRVEADHWALLATEALLRQKPRPPAQPDGGDTRALLIEHAAQICRSILDQSPDYPPNTTRHGCLTDGGRTTPTATRLEGLLAALRVLPADHPQRAAIRRAVDAGIRFLMRAQRRDGAHPGAVPARLPLEDAEASEVRIDYVQHAVSAWIAYFELLDSGPAPTEAQP